MNLDDAKMYALVHNRQKCACDEIYRLVQKHDTEANWNKAVNFKPKAGELIVYEVDTTHNAPRLKVGDGKTVVFDLPFFFEGALEELSAKLDQEILDRIKAVSDAIKIAETDATEKANNAELNANSYTDNAIANLSTDFQTKLTVSDTSGLKLSDSGNLSLDLAGATENTHLEYNGTKPVWKANLNLENGTGAGSLQQRYSEGQATGWLAVSTGYKSIASGASAFAENNSEASGTYAHAEGQATKSTKIATHSEGYQTTASGDYGAHSEGSGTKASGSASHAEGYQTTASGFGAHAEGGSTQAIGNYSHAEGGQTTADAQYSHAAGFATRTTNIAQFVCGIRNTPKANTLFEVGNGSFLSQASGNAFEVCADGRAKVYGTPTENEDVVRKQELDTKYDKTGGTVGGNVTITGDLTVNGTQHINDTENLNVENAMIYSNANGATLATNGGIGIKTNSTDVYGIVYDPNADSVKLGLGKSDSNGVFTFNTDEGEPVAVRDDSSKLTNNHLIKWDSANNKLSDSSKTIDDLLTKDEGNSLYVAHSEDQDGKFVLYSRTGGNVDTVTVLGTTEDLSAPTNVPVYRDSNSGTAVNGYLLTNTPINDYQASNKKYVDDNDNVIKAQLTNKLDIVKDRPNTVYVNGGRGTPDLVGFAATSMPANSMARRTAEGALFASNVGIPFNDITLLTNDLGKRVVYVGGDKTISKQSKITINSNIYDVDFNGATITVNQGELGLVADTFDGLIKGHSHCVIHNLNLVVNIAPYSTNTALTGYNVLDKFGGMENVLVTINSSATSSGSVNITLRGIANADHISNTKVNLDCNTDKVTSICFSYCNYLVWARTRGNNDYAFAECNYLTNCTADCEKDEAFLNCSMLSNCTYLAPEDVGDGVTWVDAYTSTVGNSPLDSIQDYNYGKTKAYVKPANGSGITPAIDVDTEPNGGTIVRRLTDGQIRAADAKAAADLTTLAQVNTITSSYVQGNPTQVGTTNLTKVKIGNVIYNIPQDVDAYTKAETDALLDTKANVSDIPTVSTLGKTGQLKDGVEDATHRLVTDIEKSTWNSKQAQLTDVQLDAVNSGITSAKVTTYDNYAASIENKVDKVDGKGLSTNDFTDVDVIKLNSIEDGAQVNTITSINNKTGAVVLTASDVSAAPINHASSATTYGVGTTTDYGHVKLVTGDQNGKTAADGIATAQGHTHSQYLLTAGGSITGNLTIGGNLTINGTTTTIESQTLAVKDKLIEVASGNTERLTTPAGLVVPKYDGVTSGALVFDGGGTAYVGDVTLDTSGNIDVNNSDLVALAARSATIADGNIVKWDNTNLILVDTDINVDNVAKKTDLVEVTANPTLTGDETNLTGLQVGDTKYGIKALKVTIW